MYCIVLICRKPHQTWIDFLNNFTAYSVYMVIDDNDTDYKTKYPNSKINFVQILNSKCEEAGYTNMNYTVKKIVTGWEKAIYYFANVETAFNNIWFIEDDVFFYDEATLQEIDKAYPNSDLLSNDCTEYVKGTWLWSNVKINSPLPYYHAMVCATRLSKPLIDLIKAYAEQNKTLYFLEALFPTICKNNGLIYDFPKELKQVLYDVIPKELDKTQIYHPIKKISTHAQSRILLNHKG